MCFVIKWFDKMQFKFKQKKFLTLSLAVDMEAAPLYLKTHEILQINKSKPLYSAGKPTK